MIGGIVKGGDRLIARLGMLRAKNQVALARATTRAAFLVQKRARLKILNPPKTGVKRGAHQASAPGEAPASDTGNLANSIRVVNAKPGIKVQAEVRVGTKYARALEFGSRVKGRILAPRPFMKPAMDESQEDIAQIFAEEMKGGDGK